MALWIWVGRVTLSTLFCDIQLGLGVFLKLSFKEENSGFFYVTWESSFLSRRDFLWYYTDMSLINFPFYHDLFLFFMFLNLSSINYISFWDYTTFFYKDKLRSCCWNIIWFVIYLAILFLLSPCYLLLLSNQNQSISFCCISSLW